MNLVPLGDCVLIEPEPSPDYLTYKSRNGESPLVLPDAWKHGPEDRPFWGRVIAKGAHCRETNVTVGDRVLYSKYGWAKVQLEGEGDAYVALCREGDIIAVDRPA